MMTTCLTCGELSEQAYCQDHRPASTPKAKSAAQRGYDYRWRKLSKRARRIQPFCSDCGTTENLQCDHSPKAWERYYTGKNIRLIDVDVVCGDCNNARGQARPGGKGSTMSSRHPLWEAKSLTDSDLNYFDGGNHV